jgi:glycerophosphoryl diester phosphodiesterase
MLVIGHRGAKGLAPENTLSSLQAGIAAGVDMIEIDLRRAKDGRIVLSHDPDLAGEYAGAAELAQVLSAVDHPINLEIKEIGFEAEVLQAIQRFPSKVLISSFKPQVLKKIRALDRGIRLGSNLDPDWKNYFYPLLALAKMMRVESIHIHNSILVPTYVRWAHRFGFQVHTWAVNDPAEYARVREIGVDGVFTDYPNIIKK